MLSSAYRESRPFSVSHSTPPVSRLGIPKDLEEDRSTTANPYRPQGYSIPQGVILRKKKKWGTGCVCSLPVAAWGLADNRSPAGGLLLFFLHHTHFLGLIFIVISPSCLFSFFLINLSLSQPQVFALSPFHFSL